MRGRDSHRFGWRVLCALVALVALPSLSPDLFGRTCPHHAGDHGGSHDVPAAPGAPAPTQHAPSPAGSPGSHGGGGSPCTCAGNCPVTGSVTVPATFPALRGSDPSRTAIRAAPASVERLPPSPYLLPFANAPPAV